MPLDMDDLPMRLRPRAEQPADWYRERRMRFFIKSAEFRKIYNKAISPYLRQQGFKASGFKGIKQDDRFSYMVTWGSSKYGGEGCLDVYVHPVGFPTNQDYAWTSARATDPSHAVFKKYVGRENPNDWVDWGTNVEEAQETCEFLLHHLQTVYPRFVSHFDDFPGCLLAIGPDNFEERYAEVHTRFGLAQGNSKYYAAIFLARLHCVYESDRFGDLAEIAREEILRIMAERGEDPAWFNEQIDQLKTGVLSRY